VPKRATEAIIQKCHFKIPYQYVANEGFPARGLD